jgi:hypothetical protein
MSFTSSLTGLPPRVVRAVIDALRSTHRHPGRPWAAPLPRRVIVVCTSLRTNLTFRELAAAFGMSVSQVHRIVTDLGPRIAALLATSALGDRRRTWIVGGTLVPTRDHRVAAKSKTYRWACNLQVLVRHGGRRVIAIAGGGPGNRNDPVHYAAPRSSACAAYTAACSPTVATAASNSSSVR